MLYIRRIYGCIAAILWAACLVPCSAYSAELPSSESAAVLGDFQGNSTVGSEPAAVLSQVQETPLAAPAGPKMIFAPKNIEIRTGGDKILLAWESWSGQGNTPAAYYVYRSEQSLDPDHLPAPINLEPIREDYFLDSVATSSVAPQHNAEYYYAVAAADAQGNSSDVSREIRVRNIAELCRPVGLEARAGDRSVQLSWLPVFCAGENGLAGYRLYRSNRTGEMGSPLHADPLTQIAYTDQGSPEALLENGTAYFYTVVTQDNQGQLSEPSEQVAATPYIPASAPQNVTATGKTDDMIEISWESSNRGTFPLQGYNVYRQSEEMSQPEKINRELVRKSWYVDSEQNSVTKPMLGRTYRYTVRALDEAGNEGELSSEASAAPMTPLEIPQQGLLSTAIPGLPPESSLTISGRKKIDVGYTEVIPVNMKKGITERYPSITSGLTKGFELKQELQVKLQGKVGKKITVDVDYDDTVEEQRKISIIYTGDPDEVVQEAAFGDITLDLPSTEFAGYNKRLFGAKLKVRMDDFEFTAIGAQTKGITVTEIFKGNTSQKSISVQDVNFEPFKYYFLTKAWPTQVNYPDLPSYNSNQINHGIAPGSVQIYVTDGQTTADTVRVDRLIGGNTQTANFNLKSPGIDYTVDYERGIVTFTQRMQQNWLVAVAYRYNDANGVAHSVGYTSTGTFDFTPSNLVMPAGGITSDAAHLIQDYNSTTNIRSYDMMLMNRYALGYQNILDPKSDPEFQIKVYTASGSSEIHIDQPTAQNSENIYTIDPNFGTIEFKHLYPFQQGIMDDKSTRYLSDNYEPDRDDAYNPNLNVSLGGGNNSQANRYKIEVQFKNLITNFNLSHWNIIKNSEVIKNDGQKLLRNSDYYIDYDTGFITFMHPESITKSSEITITYEYMPFGGKYQTNIFGARATYDLIPKKFTLGTTYLFQSSQTPLDIPDIRSTPTSLSLIDGDVRLALNPDDFSQLVEPILGKTTVPVTTDVTAEIAYSHYEINTFRYSGESGVAMIDNMDGSDNVLSLPPDNNAWVPSSAPEGLYAIPANRNYIRQSVVYELGRLPIDSNDKKHQLRWSFNGQTNSTWDGFIYPISSSGMNLNDYSFIELSVYCSVVGSARPLFYVDLGVLSEDSNGNGRMNFEGDRSRLGIDEDNGIENYISGYDSNNQPVFAKDPTGPKGIYPTGAPGGYWGDGNNRLNNEDMDRNDQLDTTRSYYQYVTPLSYGWNYVKIPLSQFSAALGDYPPVTDVQSQQFLSFVKHARMWMTSATSAPLTGYIQFESIYLSGNKWQAKVSPGTTNSGGQPVTEVDPEKINVTTISQETDSNYIPNTNFYIYDEENVDEELRGEQALKVTFNLNDGDINTTTGMAAYYFTHTLDSQGYDYSGYRYLSLDVLKKTNTLRGEFIFVRLALDENNYYEYKFSLDESTSAKKGEGDYWILGAWHTLQVELDGRDGKRSEHFQPDVIQGLHQIKEISLGISNPNTYGRDEILWINNLRVSGGEARVGTAYRVTSDTTLADIVNVKTDHREVDADFISIDENPGGKQHTISEEVSARVTKFNFMPISARWNRSETFTEEEDRAIPAYSNNFTRPDVNKETISGSVGFNGENGLSGLDLNLDLSRAYTSSEYIEQRTNPNRDEWLSTVRPSISYALPDRIGDWSIGSTAMTGKLTYSDSHITYDAEGTSKLGRSELYDRWKHSYEEDYTYTGSYSPILFLRLDPKFTYSQVRDRGFLSHYTFYTELDPNRDNPFSYSEILRLARVDNVAELNVYLNNIPIITPSATYRMTNTRDYINDTLSIPGQLNLQSGLALGDIGGWTWIPQINASQNYSVSATYRKEIYNDPMEDLNFSTQWLILPTEFQDINPLFDQAYINSKTRTDGLRTSFNITPEVSLSPRYSYTWKRSMNTPGNFRTTETMSTGSNLIWSQIPFFEWMTFQNLSLNYDYYETHDYDTNSVETQRQKTHNSSMSLPFQFSTDLRGDMSLGYKNGLRSSGVDLQTLNFDNEYSSGLAFTYNLRMVDPIRLPNFWPFSGALIKIEQTLLLQNAFTLVWVRNYEDKNPTRDVFTDTYTNETTVKYSLWKNVDGSVKFINQWYYDLCQDNKDYWAISLKAGLTAIF